MTQELGKLIGELWQKQKEKGENLTVGHFLELDISKRGIYRYIDLHETRGTTDQKKGSGGHNRRMTYIKELKVRKISMTAVGLASEKWPTSWILVRDVLEEY